MEADRLNRMIAALAVLYVIYIAVALSWSRLRNAIRERPRWERRGPPR
jgi:uncharacterized membrane protein YqjE